MTDEEFPPEEARPYWAQAPIAPLPHSWAEALSLPSVSPLPAALRRPRQLTPEDLAAVRLAFERAGRHIGTLLESMLPLVTELGKQFVTIAQEFSRAMEAIERATPEEESGD